jgi:hypothetical protein
MGRAALGFVGAVGRMSLFFGETVVQAVSRPFRPLVAIA